MRRCIIVSSLFQTFPESRRQVLNLNAGKAYLVESVFFATSRITGIEPPLLLMDFLAQLLQPSISECASSGSSSENSFDLRVLEEPWPVPVVRNIALEASLSNRIRTLENSNSVFLLNETRGQHWSEVRKNLTEAPNQEEYNRRLDFENRDLFMREKRTECSTIFLGVLSRNPVLAENASIPPHF
jgi:hypothetical protein